MKNQKGVQVLVAICGEERRDEYVRSYQAHGHEVTVKESA